METTPEQQMQQCGGRRQHPKDRRQEGNNRRTCSPHKFRKGLRKGSPQAKRGREQEAEEEFLMDQDLGLDGDTIC